MNPRPQRSIQDRAFQILLVVSTLVISWLGMMVVHEFGHVLFAWLSGGSVARVVLSPLEFSRTDLQRNPHPLFVASGGALVGDALPLLVASLWRLLRWPGWYILQFFAGFCLVANGIYLLYFGVFVHFLAEPSHQSENPSQSLTQHGRPNNHRQPQLTQRRRAEPCAGEAAARQGRGQNRNSLTPGKN